MKKKAGFRLMFTALIAALVLVNCEIEEKEETGVLAPKVSPEMQMLGRLPGDSQVLVKFGSLETLYEQFAVTGTSALGISLDEKNIEKMKADLGFNPLKPDEVRTAGFDPGKPFCLSLSDIRVRPAEKSSFDMLGLLPVSDGKRALETARKILSKNTIAYEEFKENETSYLKWSGPEGYGCLTVKGNYLYLAVNPRSDPYFFLASVLKNGSALTDARAFQEVISKTDINQELVFFINIADLVENNLNEIKQLVIEKQREKAPDTAQVLESIKGYTSATMAADLGNPNFTVDTIIALEPDSQIKEVWDIGEINREMVLSIPDPAVLLISFSLNIMKYYDMITGIMPPEKSRSFHNRLDSSRQASGIDIEKELINNLAGGINLGIYDGASITMLNYNTVLTVGVKDQTVMEKVVEKAIRLIPPEKRAMISRQKVGGINAYVMNAGLLQVYAGVANNKFLVATGKPMFEKALEGKRHDGFISMISDEHLKKSLTVNQNLFYVDLDELVKIVNNFAIFLREPAGGKQKLEEKINAAGKFEYLLTSSKLKENLITSEFKIRTRFDKPFFIGVAGLVEELELNEKSPAVPK